MSTVKTYKGHDVPEGATHYGADTLDWAEGFYKTVDGQLYSWLAKHDIKWDVASRATDMVELPQEQFVPVVGEVYALSGNIEAANGESGLTVDFPMREGLEVKIHVRFTDSFGVELFAYTSIGQHDRFGGIGVPRLFTPVKTKREKIKDWVNSKIDCNMDEAIMLTKLLDLNCLVIPESDK